MEFKEMSLEQMECIEGGLSCGWALGLAGASSVLGLLSCAGILSCGAGMVGVIYAYDTAYTSCGLSGIGG